MPPDLVVVPGGDTHKIFPGGVIAVRAADFLGPARGTLSTESNALSSAGTVVRDTQQLTPVSPPFLGSTDYGNADDTLVMDAADIGVEDGMTYFVMITYQLEGEWDLTNEALLRACSNLNYESVGIGGLHGTASQPEASPNYNTNFLCRTPHFNAFSIQAVGVDDANTLHFRFATQDGTSAEWLIDQLVFFPRSLSPNWVFNQDIRLVGPNASVADIIDGADGGDDNGKFTRFVGITLDDFNISGAASADYQRKSDGDDAEYDQKITTSSNESLFNSVGTDSEANAWGYGLYCARYREQQTYSEDTFDNRDTSGGTPPIQNFGVDENGYGYSINASSSIAPPEAFVDGSVGILRLNHEDQISAGWGSTNQGSTGPQNQGADFHLYDQWDFSGELEWTAGDFGTGSWRITSDSLTQLTWAILIDPVNASWELCREATNLGSTHDISSWFGLNSPLGFRMEIKRYVLRARVWDASGAEPGTWDEEIFKPAYSGGQVDYDYSDNLTLAGQAYQDHTPLRIHISNIGTVASTTYPYEVTIHNLKFDYDPYGDPADMYVRMERPPATPLTDMTIPWGCPYWVYWGLKDWTDPSGLTWDLVYSELNWNDTAAAEIQRAETTIWWFRANHFNPLVGMNWRYADRRGKNIRGLNNVSDVAIPP